MGGGCGRFGEDSDSIHEGHGKEGWTLNGSRDTIERIGYVRCAEDGTARNKG